MSRSYVPPRQVWNQGPGRSSPGVPSPLHIPPKPQEPIENRSAAPSQRAPSEAGDYYEDVDPRFAEPPPAILQPGPSLDVPGNYEDIHVGDGSRSPAISERSGFTSISQRGINPRWNPPPPGPGYGQQMPPRRPVGRTEVNVLNSNPDFGLPTTRGGNPAPAMGPGGGMIPGSAYPGL